MTMPTEEEVRAALAGVLDPEYPVGLVDLGLVRGIAVGAGTVHVEIAYCSLGCPCIELIEEDVRRRLLELDGVQTVEVEEVFEPWSRRDVSAKGLRLLREAGVG